MSKVTQKKLLITTVTVVLLMLFYNSCQKEEIKDKNKSSWEGTYEGACDKYDILDDNGEILLISSKPVTIPEVNYTIQINKSYASVTMDSDAGIIYCDSLQYKLSEDNFTLTIDFEPGDHCATSDIIITEDAKIYNVSKGRYGQPSFTIKKIQ